MDYLAIEHIVATPGVCGGKPRIANTRMRVQDVAVNHKSGMTVEEIMEGFGLEAAQVYAALAYYYDHQEEIDRQMREGEEIAKQFLAEGKAQLASDLRDKIEQRRKKK